MTGNVFVNGNLTIILQEGAFRCFICRKVM